MATPDAILIVGGGLLQVPAVPIARELGLTVVVTDADPNAPAMQIADEPVALDTFDVEGHLRLVEDLRQRYRLRGIFCEGADVEVTVAAAAAHAGLPGIPVEVAMNTKNKARMRACFERAGIPNPRRWAHVSNAEEAREEAGRIGYPLMVKALDNSASRGTMRVTTAAALDAAVKSAMASSSVPEALLESCFVGDEQSVELLFDERGRCHRLNIVDRPFATDDAYAIELGHVNPTRLNAEAQDRLFGLTERAAAATGVGFGAFKADTIWAADGPRILEVTARLSGGFDCQCTTPLATGRSFIRAAMKLAIGLPLDPADLRVKWRRYAAAWVAFPPPGRVVRIDGTEDTRALPGVREVFLRVRAGDVIRPYHDCAARPAFVVAVGETYDEAMRRARAGAEALQIVTVPA